MPSRKAAALAVPFLAGGAAAAVGAVISRAFTARAGLGPHGWAPQITAVLAALALGFLIARGGYRLRIRESMPLRLTGAALLAAGVLTLPLAASAKAAADALVRLAAGRDAVSAGLAPETFAAFALTAPVLVAASMAWAGGAPSGAPRRLGASLLGGLLGLVAARAGWGFPGPALPVVPAVILLATGAFLLTPGRRETLERIASVDSAETTTAAPYPQAPVRGPWALPLVLAAAGFSLALLVAGVFRLLVVVAGRSHAPGAAELLLPACAAMGALAVPRSLARHQRGPIRSLSFFLGMTGMAGLAVAVLGDRLPAAYVEVMGRYGLGDRGERAAAAAVALVAVAGIALFGGAAAGASASLSRSLPLALGLSGAVPGLLASPLLFASVGARGVILVGSAGLVVAGGFAGLLGAGGLPGRALRSLALLAAGTALLWGGEPWDLRRILPAPSQHPDRYLSLGSAIMQRRTGRDRPLAYEDGPRSSAGVFLVEGQIPAVFLDGRARATGGHDASRSLALAGHLPFILGKDPERFLVSGPLIGETWEALRLHEPPFVDLVAADAATARLLLASGDLLRPGGGEPAGSRPRILRGDLVRALAARARSWDRIVVPPGIAPESLAAVFDPARLVRMKESLAPGGLVIVALPLDGLDTEALRAAAGAFESVLPQGRAWFTRTDLILAGGSGPVVTDLGLMASVCRRRGVAESLATLGLDDPLKIVALEVRTAALAGEGASAAPEAIRRGASHARLEAVAAENMRLVLEAHAADLPPLAIPESFSEEARQSVGQRVHVLREVTRLVVASRIAYLEGAMERAQASAGEALARDPSDLEARYLLARGLIERAAAELAEGDISAARADDTEALDLYPASVQALADLAWIRYADGDRAGAEQLLHRALDLAPWIAQTHYRLGLLRFEAGDAAGAMDELNEAHWLDPQRPEPLLLMGDMARLEGDSERARRLYERALQTGARSAESHAALAAATLESGDVDRGLEEIEAALREKPGDPEALMTRARIRLRRGEREAARRDLLAAVATGGARYRARALLEPALREVLLGGEASPE